jgi:hydrogenase/urease accessory protein HupE
MNFEQFAMAGFVLIGLVNGLQFALDRNWRSFAMFCMAVIAGALFGLLGWFGLPSMEVGLAVGISSSGVYKVAQKLGGS